MKPNKKHSRSELKALLALMLVMPLFVNCTSDDKSIDTIQPITFTTPIIDGISRAVITDTEQRNPYDTRETFRVFCIKYNKNTDLLALFSPDQNQYDRDGEVVRYIENKKYWNTDKTHFWSGDGRDFYAFRAYSPADIDCAHYDDDATGLKLDNYTTPEIGKQYDLLFSPAMYDLQGINSIENMHSGVYSRVNIIFNHALSSVHFRVNVHPRYIKDFEKEQRDEEASRYSIKQITLSNVYNNAWFNENAFAERDEHGKIVNIPASSGKINMWTRQGYNSSVSNSYDFIDPSSPVTGIGYKETAQDIQELNPKSHVGFMIPQMLPQDVELSVQWQYRGKNETKEHVSYFYYSDITEAGNKRWDMGRRYIYTLSIWGDTLQLAPSAENMIENAGITKKFRK